MISVESNNNIEAELIMQENLERMIRNENYFSCLFDKNQEEEEPVNPFRKRMFDKNLRRSTVSCGHYQSTSQHNQSKNDYENINGSDSSRVSMKEILKINNNNTNREEEFTTTTNNMLTEEPLMIERTQKMTLAESRQSIDPHKERITQIINNFRLELDYLEEKLHSKVDIIKEKNNENANDNNEHNSSECTEQSYGKNYDECEINFMIESLEKIIGFMIENCVNLEDTLMYNEELQEQQEQINSEHQEHLNNSQEKFRIKKETYQIYDHTNENEEESKENISFGQYLTHNTTNYHHNHTQNYHNHNKSTLNNRNNNPVGQKKEQRNYEQLQENENNRNLPNTYFINDKLHSSHEKPIKNIHKSNHTKTRRYQEDTDKIHIKPHNRRISQTNNHNDYHYHSFKENHYNSCPIENQQIPTKSIYETVLEEREMRIKMKKRII